MMHHQMPGSNNLARSYEEAQGTAIGIGDGVQFGVHAAPGSSDQPSRPPFLTRRLEAVRCALR